MDEKNHKIHRSSITGKFVTEEEVKEHPDTTVTETVHPHPHEELPPEAPLPEVEEDPEM